MGSKFYKMFSMVTSILAGMVISKVFAKAWTKAAHQEKVPAATDEESRMREVLSAAALQGATTAVVKAGMNRGSAKSVRRMTGAWPA